MSHSNPDTSDGVTMQAIMTALRACYGSLDEPSFHKVSETLRSDPFHHLIEALRSDGIVITDTTDLNDDVSIRLVLDRSGDQAGLALSGVGPYAALTHQDATERYFWVTKPEKAPTSLGVLVAQIVQRAGFQLLDRSLVSQTIRMNWYDGSERVTLCQALFSDSDQIR